MNELSETHSPTFERLPLFLDLAGRRVLVVGGGPVACSKLQVLKATGAAITIVAPHVLPDAALPGVQIHRRSFRDRDLDGVWLVVAAATARVNAQVARTAGRRHVFVNAVDDPSNASAYFGGTIRRGDITVAISSSGRAPGLVRLLREALEHVVPEDIDKWLAIAKAERDQWKRNKTRMSDRTPLLAAAIRSLYPDT